MNGGGCCETASLARARCCTAPRRCVTPPPLGRSVVKAKDIRWLYISITSIGRISSTSGENGGEN